MSEQIYATFDFVLSKNQRKTRNTRGKYWKDFANTLYIYVYNSQDFL